MTLNAINRILESRIIVSYKFAFIPGGLSEAERACVSGSSLGFRVLKTLNLQSGRNGS